MLFKKQNYRQILSCGPKNFEISCVLFCVSKTWEHGHRLYGAQASDIMSTSVLFYYGAQLFLTISCSIWKRNVLQSDSISTCVLQYIVYACKQYFYPGYNLLSKALFNIVYISNAAIAFQSKVLGPVCDIIQNLPCFIHVRTYLICV